MLNMTYPVYSLTPCQSQPPYGVLVCQTTQFRRPGAAAGWWVGRGGLMLGG